MTERTFPQVTAAIGLSRDTFHSLKRRGLIPDDVLPETEPGVARPMTRRAALFLAFMKALLDCGFEGSQAAERAYALASSRRPHRWIVYDPVGKVELPLGAQADADKITLRAAADMFGEEMDEDKREGGVIGHLDGPGESLPSGHFGVIYVAGIVMKIDRLFGKQGVP